MGKMQVSAHRKADFRKKFLLWPRQISGKFPLEIGILQWKSHLHTYLLRTADIYCTIGTHKTSIHSIVWSACTHMSTYFPVVIAQHKGRPNSICKGAVLLLSIHEFEE